MMQSLNAQRSLKWDDRLSLPAAQGRFTAECVLRTRPKTYRAIVQLLADPDAKFEHIDKLHRVFTHTVRAIKSREAVAIAERKQRLMSSFFNVAEISAERMEELAGHASLRDAGTTAGIATGKLLALSDAYNVLHRSWTSHYPDALGSAIFRSGTGRSGSRSYIMKGFLKLRHFFSDFRSVPQKFDTSRAAQVSYGDHHRSGWNYAIHHLQLLHRAGGVFVDGFIERTHLWGDLPDETDHGTQLCRRPWVGFIHYPCEIPEWYHPATHPQHFLKTPRWKESEETCLGLYCLSEREKEKLAELTKLPLEVVRHPTETPRNLFSSEKFLANPEKKILQVGYWLRKMHSIYFLKAPGWKKAILPGIASSAEKAFETERQRFQYDVERASIATLPYQKPREYDELLSKNIVFLDLYDSSANNIIVECIVRNTPVLVNRLPTVMEYLGEEYPFYFSDLEEASAKVIDTELACKAYEYLKTCSIKGKLSPRGFLRDIVNSRIYENLPLPD